MSYKIIINNQEYDLEDLKALKAKLSPLTIEDVYFHVPAPVKTCDKKCSSCSKMELSAQICPECLSQISQEELDIFGGVCEECSGAFDE